MPPLKPRDPRVTINKEFASAEDFVDQYVVNISTSGVFVRCDEDLDVGMHVNLNFTILAEDIETITGIGEIVRVQANPRGIGVEFRSMSAESMELIERLVASQAGGPGDKDVGDDVDVGADEGADEGEGAE